MLVQNNLFIFHFFNSCVCYLCPNNCVFISNCFDLILCTFIVWVPYWAVQSMLSSVFQLMDLVCPAGVSTVPVHTLPLYPAAFSEEARSKAAVTTSRQSEQLADDEQTDVFSLTLHWGGTEKKKDPKEWRLSSRSETHIQRVDCVALCLYTWPSGPTETRFSFLLIFTSCSFSLNQNYTDLTFCLK